MWIDSSGENKSAYLSRQSFRLLNAFSSKQCVALQWGAHQHCSVVLWRGGEQGCVSLGTLEVALSTHVPLLHQTNVRLDTFCCWIIDFASHQPPGQFDALAKRGATFLSLLTSTRFTTFRLPPCGYFWYTTWLVTANGYKYFQWILNKFGGFLWI